MQRTGTTSVGQFFKDYDYKVATWNISRKNNWSVEWFKGDFESIFRSNDFRSNQVFEDDPWWCPDFYKVLFHRFPKSKFVLLERDADEWFNSMVKHSSGKTLGNTHLHAVIYNRLDEFSCNNFKEENRYTPILDNLLPLDETYRKKYTSFYKLRNKEVKDYFDRFGKDRIIIIQLEDKDKWQKLGLFLKIKVNLDYEVHANKSK